MIKRIYFRGLPISFNVFSLEESRMAEKRLADDKKSADNYINGLNQQITELKVTLQLFVALCVCISMSKSSYAKPNKLQLQ